MGVTLSPALGLFGPLVFYLGVGLSFKTSKCPFAQARVKCNGFGVDACVLGDGFGSAVGTLQIAGVNVVNAAFRESDANPLRLPLAAVIERDVKLPLNTRVYVPGRFAVANRSNPNGG
jgi:hypothetical protein